MNDLVKKVISFGILVLILVGLYYYITEVSGFEKLVFLQPGYIPLVLALYCLTLVTNGIIIVYLLKPFQIELATKEWFGLSVITSFYNTITPFKGGAVARAVYLKKKYNFPYTTFLATLSGTYILGFFIAGLTGLAAAGLLYMQEGSSNPLLTILLAGVVIALLPILVLSPQFKPQKRPIISTFIRIANGWHAIRKNYTAVLVGGGISLINILIVASMLFIEFRIFGINTSISAMILLASISNLSLLISITPGSLGIKEAVLIFTAISLQIPSSASVAVSILDRVISLIVLGILGPLYSYYLLKRSVKKENSNGRKNK